MTSQHKKVLLVDDEPKLIAALRRRLSLDFNIVTANGGPEALEMIDKDPDIAVIVADMQMPVMNGIELLRAVKTRAPSIRRLMLTGNSDQDTAIAAVNEGGVMRFFRKPCDNDELKAALRQALDEYAFQSADNVIEEALPPAVDSADHARDAFLSVMNHELRTPLNHIVGFARLLEQENGLTETDNAVEFVKHIRGSGEQVLNVLDRILEFTRLASQRGGSVDETSDIVGVVNAEVEKIRKTARHKGVTVSIDSLRLKADIIAKHEEASMAIRELLSNAVKFNVEGGHVSILIKCDQQRVAVRIADTGKGAPPALLDRMGKPFQQADSSTSREHEGLGLGLALVNSVAEANGASFSISGGVGGGITATLIFKRPVAEAATAVA
ncbi:hybrid sensor histidine kinase/response regulator [Marinicaulis aureus]|uniref:histidine kinase n=1 Tax=Hyphococcus aureus TaxID=2666033 RepID=A0ABW1KZK2_9PROT